MSQEIPPDGSRVEESRPEGTSRNDVPRKPRSRKTVLVTIAAIGIAIATATAIYFLRLRSPKSKASHATSEAPPDLAKLRPRFVAGVEALRRGQSAEAVAQLRAFTFGRRAVEEYRLYYLADAARQAGNPELSRRTLAELWNRRPRLVYKDHAALALAALYRDKGAWRQSAELQGEIAARSPEPLVQAAARRDFIEAKFYTGDVAGMLYAAYNVVVQNPRAPQVAPAIELIRSFHGLPATAAVPMNPGERVSRAANLLRDGDPQHALDEVKSIDAPLSERFREEAILTRGLALQKLNRFQDSDTALEPLFNSSFKYAIPALRASARNNRVLAASINPTVIKMVSQKEKAGFRTVRRKGKKPIRKPKYRTVKKPVKLIDLAAQARQQTYQRAATERLQDLLELPVDTPIRKETLGALIEAAMAKNQDDYLQTLIAELIKIDRLSEAGLQRFWDKGWAAYTRGDFVTARQLFHYISNTYESQNVRRQASYWYARTLERANEKRQATEIYERLANSRYEDLYARLAQKQGVKRSVPDAPNPLQSTGPDWPQVAEAEMPPDLRLSYELSALGLRRESREELKKNANDGNRKYADAILTDLAWTDGNLDLALRSLRRAWPELATVEQDGVPRYFLRMYYPLEYEEEIRKYSAKRGLNPYLMMALIRQESAFKPNAKSVAGATGLMQLMPATGRELGKQLYIAFTDGRLANPDTNINIGTTYFKQLLALMKGSEELAIAGYNGGPYRIKRWREANRNKPLDEFLEGLSLSETRNYVKRVILLESTYRRFYALKPAS